MGTVVGKAWAGNLVDQSTLCHLRKKAPIALVYHDGVSRAEIEKNTEAAKLLADAQKPVIVCGSGVHLSGAYGELLSLAEMLKIPVVTNPNGKGCFPEEHPLYMGVMGTYGRPISNDIVREADLVFLLGTRAGRMQMEEFASPVVDTSKIIHLDIDPIVIGRTYRPDVALVGDANTTLQDMLRILEKLASKPMVKQERLVSSLEESRNTRTPLFNKRRRQQSIFNRLLDSKQF